MPKILYLFRHGESVEKQLREHDKDRELSPTGVKDSIQIGSFLVREHRLPDVIFTSSSVRTTATSQLAADAMKFDPEKIIIEDDLYEASTRTFFEFITNFACTLLQFHALSLCVNDNESYLFSIVKSSGFNFKN